ncbi:hypothetical protein YB2330_005776 [Saitoella coloradoensis]
MNEVRNDQDNRSEDGEEAGALEDPATDVQNSQIEEAVEPPNTTGLSGAGAGEQNGTEMKEVRPDSDFPAGDAKPFSTL